MPRHRDDRVRGRKLLWHPARDDPDYDHLFGMLELAWGTPFQPYKLAREFLQQNNVPGDAFNNMRKLGTKMTRLLDLMDEFISEVRKDPLASKHVLDTIGDEEKQILAMAFLNYLADHNDPWKEPGFAEVVRRFLTGSFY